MDEPPVTAAHSLPSSAAPIHTLGAPITFKTATVCQTSEVSIVAQLFSFPRILSLRMRGEEQEDLFGGFFLWKSLLFPLTRLKPMRVGSVRRFWVSDHLDFRTVEIDYDLFSSEVSSWVWVNTDLDRIWSIDKDIIVSTKLELDFSRVELSLQQFCLMFTGFAGQTAAN